MYCCVCLVICQLCAKFVVFLSYSAAHGCSKCMKRFPGSVGSMNYSGFFFSRPPPKSLLFIPQDMAALPNPLPADIPSTSEGFWLFGAPIGPPKFMKSSIMDRVQKTLIAVDRG